MFWLVVLLIVFVLKQLYNKVTYGRCYSRTIMTGKVVIVTGANSGIGFETALNLARRGAKVILACRNEISGNEAVQKIKSRTGNRNVVYMNLDLSSFKSIRGFVEDFQKREAKLDVLINNAGTSGYGMKKTDDGIVYDMQANHFGPFLLTILLVPLLKRSEPSRVVMVSSVAHYFGRINFDTINEPLKSENYLKTFKLYSNTKLCNVLFSNELARRLEGTGVTVNSLHPGHIATSIYKNVGNFANTVMPLFLSTFFKNTVEGAQTIIYAAVSEDVEGVTGKYFSDCQEDKISGKAMDKELAAKLWSYSEKMVNLQQEERI